MIDFVAFSLFEFGSDMIFVLKIFMLLAIISFVWQHLGKGAISVVVIAGLAYLMLMSPFSWFFESTYVLMTLLMFGIGGVLIDFVFAFPGLGAGMESQVGSGKDLAERGQKFSSGRERMHPPKMGLPPPV
jgi:hypothetical protein